MSENASAALYYGLERSDEKTHRVLFYNLGASGLKASIAEYSRITPEGKKPIEEIKMLGEVVNNNVSCDKLDHVLADYFADEFDKKYKT